MNGFEKYLKEIQIVMNVDYLTKLFGIVREMFLKRIGCIFVIIVFG